MRCHATQINDQMHCGPCGLQWDVNDPEPPTCGGSGLRSHSAPLFKEGDPVDVQPSAAPATSKGLARVTTVGRSSDEPFGVPQYEVMWENGDYAICQQSELSVPKPQRRLVGMAQEILRGLDDDK